MIMTNGIDQVTGIRQARTRPAPQITKKGQGDFARALAGECERQGSLKISQHAQKRLDSSQVSLSESDFQRLDGALERATQKGSNQSLVMLDNLALVVSVRNKVVITAVDEGRTREGIFTNIDSVVIA